MKRVTKAALAVTTGTVENGSSSNDMFIDELNKTLTAAPAQRLHWAGVLPKSVTRMLSERLLLNVSRLSKHERIQGGYVQEMTNCVGDENGESEWNV